METPFIENQDQNQNAGVQEQWDNLAEKYGLSVLSQRDILIPGFEKYILPRVNKNDTVLDVGCGNGFYSELFAEAGAEVTGIDISSAQIEQAGTLTDRVAFSVKTIEEQKGIEAFSIIFANMLVCNLSTKESVKSFFENSQRLLKKGGTMYVTNVSPEFQHSCETGYMKHMYPDNVQEGTNISVELTLAGGEHIGPFINYHYGAEYLASLAKDCGLKKIDETTLSSDSGSDQLTYMLLSFRKE